MLQSLSIYNLAAIDPPKTILNIINAICANFLWGEGEDGHKYHLIAWSKCCLPIQEGGLGIRSMRDLNVAFSMKLWWLVRTSNSL